jgi:glycosyltransferase involved in cell wall biosynthesis
MSIKVSATIICLNEIDKIADCIQSLSFADEILVLDSGSTDGTIELCKQLGARVVHQPWLGFGKQKQKAVDLASNDWVICLDADERLSPELQLSIQHFLNAPDARACMMPRCNHFLGKWLRHGEGYPDFNLRLYNRQYARWSDDPVHEHVMTNETVKKLKGDILHFSEDGIQRYLEKQNRYTEIQAQLLLEKGKQIGLSKLLLSPIFRFIKFYFLRQGFRDGLPGLIHIAIGCMNSFVKYAKCYELHKNSN